MQQLSASHWLPISTAKQKTAAKIWCSTTISFLLHADVRATETGNCLSAMNV